MTIEITQDELIEKYFSGEMPDEERFVFEERLETDEELKHKVEAHRLLAETLREIERNEAFGRFKTLANSIDKPKGRVVFRKARAVWYSAAAVFILSIGSYIYLRSTAEERLFNRYFIAYENISQSREEGKPFSENFQKGMGYYDVGDYKQAFIWLQKADKENLAPPEIAFYTGVAALASGQAEKASGYFQKAIKEHRFAEPAEWYLALSYVKQEKMGDAERVLQNIEQSASSYGEKAQALRKELDR